MTMKGESMGKVTLLVLAVSAVVLVSGCSVMETSAFRSDGIPQQKYLVGGGWDVSFSAPCAGTVYLVEANYGKFIETKSVDEGDTYRQTIDPGESRLKEIGVEPAYAKFQLYFVPVPQAKPCSKEMEGKPGR
jgi:hypothetical protein